MTEKNTQIDQLVQVTFKGVQGHMLKKHRAVPLYKLDDHVFWPDRELMRKEAESIKHDVQTYHVKENAVTKTRSMDESTPYLQQMWEGWQSLYGNFGDCSVTYFYISGDEDYNWHIDTYISMAHTGKPKPVLCAMNIVCTDESVPAEFYSVGEFSYTAALFNTSHLHRVQTNGKDRILARITFRDHIYEEVLSRVKKRNRALS